MRPGLVVTGVLGAGTVLVFGLAGLVATLVPNGTLVNSQWNGGWGGGWGKPGIAVPMPMPMPVPGLEGIPEKGVVLEEDGGIFVVLDAAEAPAVAPGGTNRDVLPQP